ncbi:MAG: hypothetical protein MK198_03675 [Gracilimonas sp.]|uniref:hypothetical protein n=1 Tax=Gracilimonas sp. TaxID=1974203 RepID=UPI003750194C|nr:hypothetical protein [Gracilimonas sp.]
MTKKKFNKSNMSAGITGFIDILGFGNRVLEANDDRAISTIVESVRFVQSEFDFDPEKTELEPTQKTVLAFSDCIVLNIPFESEVTEYVGTFDGFMFEFYRIALAQIRCIEQSIFLRGGLDSGWWFKDGDIVVSHSLVNSYLIEGKANVPIIALSKELYNKFANHPDIEEVYNGNTDILDDMFNIYEADDQKWYFINYLSLALDSVSWGTDGEQIDRFRNAESPEEKDKIRSIGYKKNIEHLFNTHKREILKAYLKAGNDKVKAKYEWLASYHNRVVNARLGNNQLQCTLSD